MTIRDRLCMSTWINLSILFFQCLTLLNSVLVVPVIPTPAGSVGVLRTRRPYWWWDQIGTQGLVQNSPLSSLKGVYLINWGSRFSLCLSSRPTTSRFKRSFSLSFPLSPLVATLTWFMNSLNSSSCMYLATLCLSSSRFATGSCTSYQKTTPTVGSSLCDAWPRPGLDSGCSGPPY